VSLFSSREEELLPGFEHLQKHKRISGITVLRDGLVGSDLINQASKQERTKERERKDSEF